MSGVKSAIHEVAAGAIHPFVSYAIEVGNNFLWSIHKLIIQLAVFIFVSCIYHFIENFQVHTPSPCDMPSFSVETSLRMVRRV